MASAFPRLLDARRDLPDLANAPLEWLEQPADVLAYRRGSALVAANFGDTPRALELPGGDWQVAFSSTGRAGEPLDVLERDSALVLVDRQPNGRNLK